MQKILQKYGPLLVLAVFLLLVLTIARASVFGDVEPREHVYFEIVFLLLLAVLGEIAVIYLKQPSVMVLMLLGMIASPSLISLILPGTPGIFKSSEVIAVFAQLGAVILLFKVGLHQKLEGILAFDNITVAVAGVALPFAAGYLYAISTGGSFAYSMFLGAALTATSVGVTVALLKELGMLEQRFAQIIIGAAVIDDILGLLVLSFVANVASGSAGIAPLAATAISAAVFLAGGVLAGKYFVKYLDQEWEGTRVFLLVLAFMLTYAYIAEFIKLSAIVGAFLAGLVLSRSRHLREIENETQPLEHLFMPIFFISLGTLVDVPSLFQFALPIIALTLLAMASKLVACFAASLFARIKKSDALAVGIGMMPRGEVALIVASIGLTAGILSAAQYSIISAMALLTTFATPPILARVLKKE